eukprot:Nitzschia sp. Nitz4//scaffold257_size48314//14885//15814//NITZ4_007088-RA/size48314-processed-gene-0.14-mRNA-1//-1//CDS//3329544445//5568//frame0
MQSTMTILECPKESNKNFPQKLHEMLEQVELNGLENVVSWLPENKAFKVHDPPVFVQDILPHYFAMTKYKSFLRQLNIWNFTRIKSKGPEDGAYQHELFVRGKQSVCSGMKRIKIKGLYKRRKVQNTPPPPTTNTTFSSSEMDDLHTGVMGGAGCYDDQEQHQTKNYWESTPPSRSSSSNMMPLQFQTLAPYDDHEETDDFSGGRVTPKFSCAFYNSEFPSPAGTMVTILEEDVEGSPSPSSSLMATNTTSTSTSRNIINNMKLVESRRNWNHQEEQPLMVNLCEMKYVWLGMELAKEEDGCFVGKQER